MHDHGFASSCEASDRPPEGATAVMSQRSSRFGYFISSRREAVGWNRRWWPGRKFGSGRVFFVSVNQVLVRLWARRRSSILTGKRGVMNPGCPMAAAPMFRGACGGVAVDEAVCVPQCAKSCDESRMRIEFEASQVWGLSARSACGWLLCVAGLAWSLRIGLG